MQIQNVSSSACIDFRNWSLEPFIGHFPRTQPHSPYRRSTLSALSPGIKRNTDTNIFTFPTFMMAPQLQKTKTKTLQYYCCRRRRPTSPSHTQQLNSTFRSTAVQHQPASMRRRRARRRVRLGGGRAQRATQQIRLHRTWCEKHRKTG